MAVSEIQDENKYNDIIEIALDSRINPWGWHVGAQSRGGFSDPKDKSKGKQPGERDLPIFNTNKPFAICEAFIFWNQKYIFAHLEKIFNYYHQRDNLIMLQFEKKWRL